jgi:hypothetical protein
MEHLRATIATLVGLIVIVGLMIALVISASTNNPLCPAETCEGFVQCDIPQQPSPGPDAGKIPTLAPPRSITLSTADSTVHTPPLGQSVYVQVKTDHVDVEVGWASADFLGR